MGEAVANVRSTAVGYSPGLMNWEKSVRKSTEQDYAQAQLKLGFIYNHGQGIPKDFAEAAKWHRKSAERGNAL